MIRIDNPSFALAALQAEVLRRMREMRRMQPSSRTSGSAATSKHPIGDSPALKRSVQIRLGHISPDDPGRSHKVFRLFLESVFAEQFGEVVTLDSGFQAMVDEVQRQMVANPTLAARIETLTNSILHGGRD